MPKNEDYLNQVNDCYGFNKGSNRATWLVTGIPEVWGSCLCQERVSLLMHFCGMPKLFQANTVLVHKMKPRPIKSKKFKLVCDLVRMSHQSSSDQTPAYHCRIPGSITAQSQGRIKLFGAPRQ